MSVFVFGSNRLGIHGAGAALAARNEHGAVNGVGEGRTGNAYALPTCARPGLPLRLSEIAKHAATFRAYAGLHPEETFRLTRVGCGIAGFSETEIAPLFRDAPANVAKPDGW